MREVRCAEKPAVVCKQKRDQNAACGVMFWELVVICEGKRVSQDKYNNNNNKLSVFCEDHPARDDLRNPHKE